jgi:small subunit ribosomal protein S16
MVRIRLMRMGMKGQPSYRVVITDARSPRDGRFIENIGWYNPRTEPSTIKIDGERARYWLGVGAQPSAAVVSLLKRAGISPAVGGPKQEAPSAGSAAAGSNASASEATTAGAATAGASTTKP